jgi:hypothetical protein
VTPIFFAAALLVSQAATADVTPPAAANAQAAAPEATPTKTSAPKPDKNGKICHKEAVLGSRMPVRICETPDEIASRKASAKDMLEAAQRDLSNSGQ